MDSRTRETRINIRTGIRKVLTSVPNIVMNRRTAPIDKSIGVVFSNVSEHAAPKILKAINTAVSPEGYSLKVRDAFNNQAKEEKILKDFISKHISGLIIEPSKSQMLCKHMDLYRLLEKRGIPYVFIGGTYPQMVDHPKLLVDDSRGAYLLTRHLIATGRNRIIGLFKADDAGGYERHKGYVQALQEAGLIYDPDLVIWFHSEDRFKKPVLALSQLLKKDRSCDAVLCHNDMMAKVILHYLNSEGIRVPEDIAVTGYGNFNVSAPSENGLTSVELPYDAMGKEAAEMLLGLISGRESMQVKHEIILEPELVIRGSSIGNSR